MERIQDGFIDKLNQQIPMKDFSVLEIGCGNGSRSVGIAIRCRKLTAIDPDGQKIEHARKRNIENVTFEQGIAESLIYKSEFFNMVIFTLSFHHVPKEKMHRAIDEAIRVLGPKGYIVFLEPTEEGTFFDAEIQFDASDGDERQEKKNAYSAMMNHHGIRHLMEFHDETILKLDSEEDFNECLDPKKDLGNVLQFLQRNSFLLHADRRVNIFQPK